MATPYIQGSGGQERFLNELGKNTRESKDLLCAISSTIKTINTNISAENAESGVYNNNEMYVVSDTGTLTFSGNTFHSLSYIILSGTANVTVGSTTLTSAPLGYSESYTATKLLSNSITLTGLSIGTKIVITTIS